MSNVHWLINHFGRPRWNSEGDVTWVMWSLTSFHFETELVSVQDRCMVCARRTIGSEIVLTHSMVPLGDEAQVEARFGPFGDSANVVVR